MRLAVSTTISMSRTTSVRAALAEAWPRHKGRITWALFASLTLGLAPFFPHAHVWKQLMNLVHGTLTEPMDIFDLVLHGTPWVLLLVFTGLFSCDGVCNHTEHRAPRASGS
jgi:hypothetical protein